MNRLTQGLAVVCVVLFTGLLVFYSRDLSEFIVHMFAGEAPTIASHKIKIGSVTVGTDTRELYHLDPINVGAGQTQKVTTNTGWQIELLENTKAIVELYRPEQVDSPALISILSGQYKLVTAGQPGRLFVMQDKKIFSPQVAQKEESRTIELKAPLAAQTETVSELTEDVRVQEKPMKLSKHNKTPLPDKVPSQDSGETLSNSYIEQVLIGQANSLRNCQLNSVRDNKPSQGTLIFSFTILPSGKIDGLKVAKDQLQNPQLASCAVSVLDRTQFKAFSGAPIQLSYPIEFR